MANNINTTHLLNLETVINTKINEKEFADLKKTLLGGLQNLKVSIDQNSAVENAEKIAKLLNAAFKKVKMPQITANDILGNFDAQFKAFESALTKMASNISKSMFKNINDIQEAVNRSRYAGKKEVKPRRRQEIEDALNYNINDDIGKTSNRIRGIATEYDSAQTWEDRYKALTKYITAYKRLQSLGASKSALDKYGAIGTGDNAVLFEDISKFETEIRASLMNVLNEMQGIPVEKWLGFGPGGTINLNIDPNVINRITAGDLTEDGSGTVKINAEIENKEKIKGALKQLIKDVEEQDELYYQDEGDADTAEAKYNIAIKKVVDKFKSQFDVATGIDLESMLKQYSADGDLTLKNLEKALANKISVKPSDTTEQLKTAQGVADAAEKEKIAKESSAKASEKKAEADKESIAANKESAKVIEEILSNTSKNEKYVYLNTKNGKASDYIIGSESGVPKNDRNRLLTYSGGSGNFDATLHTHPNGVAAFSPEDIDSFVIHYDEFKRNFILAGEQLAEIDFSSLTQEQVKSISEKFSAMADDIDENSFYNIPINQLSNITDDMMEKFYASLKENIASVMQPVVTRYGDQNIDLNSIVDGYISKIKEFIATNNIGDMGIDDIGEKFGDIANELFTQIQGQFKDPTAAAKTFRMNVGSGALEIFDSISNVYSAANNEYQKELSKILEESISGLGLNASQILKAYNAKNFDFSTFTPRDDVAKALDAQTESEKLATEEKEKQLRLAEESKARAEEETRLAKEKEEAERLAREEKEKQARAAEEARAKAEEEARLAKEKAEAERKAAEEKEKQNLAAQEAMAKAEEEARLAKEKAEAERIAKEEAAKLAQEKETQARLASEQANKLQQELAAANAKVVSNADAPWAREDTLSNGIKPLLDQIQKNTAIKQTESTFNDDAIAKISEAIGKINVTSDLTTEGLATQETVNVIADAVKSINNKIVQGTKIIEKDSSSKSNGPSTKQGAKSPEQKIKEEEDKAWAAHNATKKSEEQIREEINKTWEIREAAIAKEEEAIAKATQKEIEEFYKAEEAKRKATEETAQKQAEAQSKKAEEDAVRQSRRNAKFGKADTVLEKANRVEIGLNNLKNQDYDNADVTKFKAKLEELKQIYDELDKKSKNGVVLSDDDITRLRNARNETDAYGKTVTALLKEMELGDNQELVDANIIGDTNTYKEQLEKVVMELTNGKAKIGEFDATTNTLNYTVQTGTREITNFSVKVRGLDKEVVKTTKSIKPMETFLDGVFRKTREIGQYLTASLSIARLLQELRRGIQYVKEIDSAMTELKKVTDETEETYAKFLKTASKTAGTIGSTIKDVVTATAEFARLGYDINQSAEMAQAAIVYTNVGDGIASVSEASESLISTLKAFGMQADESMSIVDKFNEVGNNFAITSKGIGDALQRSASALQAGGNSLDESIGLITAANSVVQDPEQVGTALKTLTMRLRGTKTELEEAGEDTDGMANSVSSLQQKLLALSHGKVNIMTDANTFKNTTEILREMATAWEDMTDIERASALELMGGKRQANILSSIIDNFDIVEDAIESASNSAGSALAENEKYLDSIQGRIDLFTNAVQTMWSDMLDSDVIKFFVDLGTKLVKLVDTLGAIPSILLAIGAAKGLKTLFTGFDLAKMISNISGLTMGTKMFTAATREETMALMNQNIQMALANSGLVQYAIKIGLASAADVAKMTTTQLLALSFKTLAVSVWGAVKAIVAFLFTNPVGWAILAAGAVAGLVAILKLVIKTTDDYAEELSNLKSELSDIQSELESVNSELETTQDRMAELLAKDKLSFTEEEELENLKKQNDELERQLDLLKAQEKAKKEEVAETFAETMESSSKNTYGIWGKSTWWKQLIMGLGVTPAIIEAVKSQSQDEYINDQINQYTQNQATLQDYDKQIIDLNEKIDNTTDEKEKKKFNKQKTKIEKKKEQLEDKQKKIGTNLETIEDDFDKYAQDVEYGVDEDADKWLDYYNNLKDRLAINYYGSTNAKSNTIKRIFNKDEFDSTKQEIDDLVEQLEEDPTNQTVLDQISEKCKIAEDDLQAVGLSVDDAYKYFTQLASEASYDNIDNKIAELDRASQTFKELVSDGKTFQLDDGTSVGLADLFNKEGKIVQTTLSQIFNDTSEQTRKDITSILEGSYKQISDGTFSAETLLAEFGTKASRQVIDLSKTLLSETNIDIFPDLADDLDGIIDKFDELSKAVKSTVDAMGTLKQARAEEANSGSVSLETLENLMKYTDDYSKLVEIDETGAIHVLDNAENTLIDTRLERIKNDAAVALQEAEVTYQEALHNQQIYNDTAPAQGVLQRSLSWVKGELAAVSSLWNDFTNGNFAGAWDRAQAAKNTAQNEKQTEWNNKASEANTALAEAEANLQKAKDNKNIADGLNQDNITSRSSSSEASGGASTPEEVAENQFQNTMDYWENRISANQAKYEQVQNEIDLLEKKGKRAGEAYYKTQIELEKERLRLLGGEDGYSGQLQEVQKRLEELENAGNKGTDEWWEVAKQINDLEGEIDDVTASIEELNNAIENIKWDTFDEITNRISDLSTQLSNVRDLLSSKDMFDDEGNFTDEGIATLATYVQELEIAQNALEDVNKEISDFTANKDAYIAENSEQQYYDNLKKLTDEQSNYLKLIDDSEQAVKDMYESQIDAVEGAMSKTVDAYKDYIDVVKESLDAEKD